MPEGRSGKPKLAGLYAGLTSVDAILQPLKASGIEKPSAADLYTRSLDCQNLGAFPALRRIADLVNEIAPLTPATRVLDVGCGLGGPGRYLADRFGCSVAGIDTLPFRVEAARELTARVGLDHQVTYRVANATALPFAGASFDQVWMLDVAVHIRAKRKLFAEIARVLVPGGLLVLHDYPGPLPASMAPLQRVAPYHAPTLIEYVRGLQRAGLRLVAWRETTELALAQLRGYLTQFENAPAPSGAEAEGRERGRELLDAYITSFERDGAVTGVLVARKSGR